MLSIDQKWSPSTFQISLCGQCYYTHFPDKETETPRSRLILPRVTQLESIEMEILVQIFLNLEVYALSNHTSHSQPWTHIRVIKLFFFFFLIVMARPKSSGILVHLVWGVDWTLAVLKALLRDSIVPPNLRMPALYYSAFETAAESCEMVEFRWARERTTFWIGFFFKL